MTGSAWVVLLVGLAAGNPPRRCLPLAAARWGVAAAGAAMAAALLLVPALAAGGLLDALDVSVPTLLVGVGLVVGVVSASELVRGAPAPLPDLGARGAAWCPVAFPHLLRPTLAVAVLGAGAAHGAGPGAALAVGVPLVTAALAGRRPRPGGGMLAAARFVAAVGVLGSVAVVVEGIFAL